jgi:hypothetical protein
VRCRDRDSFRKRDRYLQFLTPCSEGGAWSERLGQLGAPCVEALVRRTRAYWQVKHDRAALGHAQLVGADKIVEGGAERQRAAGACRYLQPDEDGIRAREHMVHQPGNGEAVGNGVTERPYRGPCRQLPIDAHRLAGVAGVFPIAVPARFGGHHQRQFYVLTGDSRLLGDQLKLHVLGPGAELGGSRDGKDERKQEKEEAEHLSALYVIASSGRSDPLGRECRSGRRTKMLVATTSSTYSD